jgi:hypothetical protein
MADRNENYELAVELKSMLDDSTPSGKAFRLAKAHMRGQLCLQMAEAKTQDEILPFALKLNMIEEFSNQFLAIFNETREGLRKKAANG